MKLIWIDAQNSFFDDCLEVSKFFFFTLWQINKADLFWMLTLSKQLKKKVA